MSNCVNIRKLGKLLKRCVEERVRALNYEKVIPKSSFKTNYYILNIISNLNLDPNERTNNIKNYLNENVSNHIKHNLGGKNLFILFNFYCQMYVFSDKNDKYLDNLSKILDIMNSNSELFSKGELESTIKILSDPMFSEIKNFYKKPINLFKKKSHKLETSNLCSAFNLNESNKFNFSFDVEHSVYALNEKDSERVITFVEMTHLGKSSVDYYNSLIKSVNPSVIFLEQEPFQKYELKKTQILNEMSFQNNLLQSINYISKDEIKEKFDMILKENGTYDIRDRYVFKRIKGMQNNVIKKGDYFITENESIIYNLINNLPSNLRQIFFNEIDVAEYIGSFVLGKYKIEEKYLRELVILLNELELTQWLFLQERMGCRQCASFFNKQKIEWQPLNTEFLIDKTFLNNYEYIINKQINNIITEYKKKENGNIVVFSSEPLTICRGFVNEIENNKTDTIRNQEDVSININNENLEKLAFPLIFKENFYNYFFKLPFQVSLDKVGKIEKLYQNYHKVARDTSLLKNSGILTKAEIDWTHSNCYPVQYIRNNFLMLEKMETFLKEKQFLL